MIVQNNNIVWHHATVTRTRREQQNQHHSAILWFTGLSGAGKSTLAHIVEESLFQQHCQTFVLDGDNVRHGLCKDLGFSDADRIENIRRVGEISKLFVEAGTIILTAFISPFRADRQRVRELVGKENFVEIYCDCSLEMCEQRDVKGLYQKARQGKIPHFTGISSPYEIPEQPDLIVNTATISVEESRDQVLAFLRQKNLLK